MNPQAKDTDLKNASGWHQGGPPWRQTLSVEEGAIARIEICRLPPLLAQAQLDMVTRDPRLVEDDVVCLASTEADSGSVDRQFIVLTFANLNLQDAEQ
jgi:hypothetical protein